ncbi:MAG: SIMPL domain-containing protein [Solirubrobacterales bacterium]
MNENTGKNWLVVALIVMLGLVLSSYILTQGLVQLKTAGNTITVTGSAKQQIKSDLIVWSGTYTAQSPALTDAYQNLQDSQKKVKAYLTSKGLDEKEMVFSSINTNINREMLSNGQYTNRIESYSLNQTVEIRSKEVDKITRLSREATELINQGVEFQSNPPQYFYTKIADLKVKMLSKATADAFTRAKQIADNAKSEVGSLRGAKMGVIQITPLYSNEISDYGINDTSSLDKEITAVVNCNFEIKD